MRLSSFADMPNSVQFSVTLAPAIFFCSPMAHVWDSYCSPSYNLKIFGTAIFGGSVMRGKRCEFCCQAEKGIESICWMSATDLGMYLASGSSVWHVRASLKISLVLDLSHDRTTEFVLGSRFSMCTGYRISQYWQDWGISGYAQLCLM